MSNDATLTLIEQSTAALKLALDLRTAAHGCDERNEKMDPNFVQAEATKIAHALGWRAQQ